MAMRFFSIFTGPALLHYSLQVLGIMLIVLGIYFVFIYKPDQTSTYWAKFPVENFYEVEDGYQCDLPEFCKCGHRNEWIKLGKYSNLWGCPVCYEKKNPREPNVTS